MDDAQVLEELASQRLSLFSEKGGANNRQILTCIALDGSMLKYDLAKKTKIINSTVSRRVDNLVARGYLAEAGKRITQRGKQTEEFMYGLTWKGFVASITIENVRKDSLQVLKANPLLAFPEKELILTVAEEIASSQEIEMFASSLLNSVLESIPNLELIDDKQMLALIMSALIKMKLPKDFKLSKIPQDAWELLDRPAIFQAVKEKIVPFLKQYSDGVKMAYLLVSTFDGFDKLFCELDARNKPSKKIKEFLEARFQKLSEKKMAMLDEEEQ